MKITRLQNKIKYAFYGALLFASIMLALLYFNLHNITLEENKCDTAISTIKITESITEQLNEINNIILTGDTNKFFINEAFLKNKKIQINDSLSFLASLNTKLKNSSIAEFITLTKKLFAQQDTALSDSYLLKKDDAINNEQVQNKKKLLNNINDQHNEIIKQQIDIIKVSGIEKNKYDNRFTKILLALTFAFCLILIFGYTIILKFIKNSKFINQSLEFNSTLLSNISDAIITVDKNLKITNWNKYAEELYGYTEAEVKGKLFLDVMQISKKDISAFYKIAKEKKVWKGEMVHLSKNNIALDVAVSTSAIYDKNNEFIGGIAVIRNISDRKKMQNEMHQLTQKLQKEVNVKSKDLNQFFERIADAFFILDNNWNYVYINNTSLKLHGKTKEELIGKNIWELYPNLVGGDLFVALETAKLSQQTSKGQFYFEEQNKWFHDLIYPDKDGISVYYTDITITKNAELEFKSTLNKLSFHLTNTPLAVLEFDSATNILQWSKKAEDMFGYSAEDIALEGIKMHHLIHIDDQPSFYEKLNIIATSNLQSEIIYNRGITKNGTVIYCEWYNSFLKNEQSNGVMLALVKDITKNKQTEIDLINAESKFRSLVEDSLVGVYIRKNKTLLYVNPRFADIFGYDVEELLNNFDSYSLIKEEDGKVIDSLKKENNSRSLHYEFEGIKKNGEYIFIEVFGNTTILNGEEVFLGTIIDITERRIATEQVKKSEIALKKSNESFEIIATATKDAIWDWDVKNDILVGNERFYELLEFEKNTTLSFDDFITKVHKDDKGRIIANSNLTLEKKGTNITEEFRIKQNNGNYKILNDKVVILYDDYNEAYRMLGAMQDITETKIANKKIKQSQLALKKSNERYEYIAKATKDAIFDWDIEHDVVTGNDMFLSYFNLPSNSKLKFVSFFERLHEADKFKMTNNFKHALKNKSVEISEEFRFKISDGSYRIFSEKAYLLYNNNNRAYRALVAMRDITEIKEAENKLLKAKDLSESTINSLPGIFFIARKYGKIQLWNKNFETLSGITAEEIKNINPIDLISIEDKEKVVSVIKSVFENGTDYVEANFVSNNGTHTPFYFTGSAIMYEDELCLLCVGIDDSEKAKAKQILKESEEKYKLLFNENPLPMWILHETESRFLDANNAAINAYGYSKEEFLNMPIINLHPPIHNTYDKWKLRTDEKKYKEMFWEHQKKDGSIIQVEIISNKIMYNGSIATLALANDITEQVKAEEKLQQSNRAFRDLATKIEEARETERTIMARDIHDELGQQLTGLKMDISWINKKVHSNDVAVLEKMKETMQLIDKTVITVRRISTALRPSILDDLGLIAAMEWQSEEFEKRFEIPTLFVSNINHIEVSTDIATGLFRIFQECLTNINRHAEATQIECNFTLIDNNITLTIADNGKGFKEEDIKNKKTLGLLGMKERVILINGTYQIKGNAGKGVSVIINVPLK